jgi:hypothetical protein
MVVEPLCGISRAADRVGDGVIRAIEIDPTQVAVAML